MNEGRRLTGRTALAIILVLAMCLGFSIPVLAIASSAPTQAPSSAASVATPAPSTPAPAASSPAPTTSSPSPATPSSGSGPHPGTLTDYAVVPGGATTLDPSVEYDTVSGEPVFNVYETLVNYNGTSTSNFVPTGALCVPGSAQCIKLYSGSGVQGASNGLIVNNAQGDPIYWTFVIDSAARFYDPSTGASWGVYPSDVVFSLARTMSFMNLPYPEKNPGWIQGQALLPQNGSYTWDGGIHGGYNNTPYYIMDSMLVNDSAYCPASAMASEHGCVTFVADGNGQDWPFFLQLVADNQGASIEPCGWFTANGAGIPGWSGSPAAHGDGPCTLPDGATTTNGTTFQGYLNSLWSNPTAWDAFQEDAYNYPNVNPYVRTHAVGSGPYYLSSVVLSSGFVLQANPAYSAPTGCAGQPGCDPLPGGYAHTVDYYYEPDDTQGIAEYEAGQTDFAGILPTDTATLLALEKDGKIGVLAIPTISTYFQPYNFNFSVALEQTIDPTPGKLNVQGDFFDYIGFRNFMDTATPYNTILNTAVNIDGVSYGENYGGAIPIGMGNYYPNNISWPAGDPVTGDYAVGTPGWWWGQANDPTSQYYDPLLAACTKATPCVFPMMGEQGAPQLDIIIDDIITEVEKISNGSIMPYDFDLTFTDLLTVSPSAFTFWNLGWAPDYPDPTDYISAIYQPNGYFPSYNSIGSTLSAPQFNATTCGHYLTTWANLVYWANVGGNGTVGVPQDCQGTAYNVANWAFVTAAPLPSTSAYRVLLYNLGEHIINKLAFYVYNWQSTEQVTYAPWINPATINTNPVIGGGQIVPFFSIGYISNVFNVYINETGLPLTGSNSWSVSFGGSTYSSATSSIELTVANGSYGWTVGAFSGYSVSLASGSVTVNGAKQALSLTFAPLATPRFAVTFSETYLLSGSPWNILLGGIGQLSSVLPQQTIELPNAAYLYNISNPGGLFNATPKSGTITVASAAVNVNVVFSTTYFSVYPVKFTEEGLPSGTLWSVTMNETSSVVVGNGLQLSSNSSTITFYQRATDSYNFTLGTLVGWLPPAPLGELAALTGWVNVTVPWAPIHGAYAITFALSFTGGTPVPTGSLWGVTLTDDNFTVETYVGAAVAGPRAPQPSPASAAITLYLGNGSVAYGFVPIAGYNSPSPGTVAVAGASQTVNVGSPVTGTYAITFVESGLPAGQTWNVELGGVWVGQNLTASSFVWYEPNGTVAFAVTATTIPGSPEEVLANPSAGTLTVLGADITQAIAFVPAFEVDFSTTGLDTGTGFSVTIGSTTESGIAGVTDAVFWLSNGTYAYTVSPIPGYTTVAPTGSITVSGSEVTTSLAFTAFRSAVTFTQSGLSGSYSWTVKVLNLVTGASLTNTSTTSTIGFALVNGSYSYQLSVAGSYVPDVPTGAFGVVGAAVPLAVTFSALYAITLTETGLPAGTTWWAVLNGQELASSTTTIAFSEVNGPYTFYIVQVNNYTVTPFSGSLRVDGAPVGQTITFAKVSPSSTASASWTSLSTLAYILIAVVAVIAIVFIALYVMARRPPMKGAQTWSQSSSGGSSGATPPSTGGSGGSSGGGTASSGGGTSSGNSGSGAWK